MRTKQSERERTTKAAEEMAELARKRSTPELMDAVQPGESLVAG